MGYSSTIRSTILTIYITFLVGCSGNILSSPDSAVFEGLDPTVVSEVLDNPPFASKWNEHPKTYSRASPNL